ncbi:sulfite exporter TauE/SafE family protein [Jiulongibacter sediminis]|uniref:Probable membrane transporter protein n=1 Tax=Jiulongibacter sediminis TaxID=1605367 RepID=A0A0P7BYC2_9BACT|nr:sulfite exporter TauE/SafE family protein [Jiulongibacter sediminis]KPM49846.1 ABC transporter permease [Jiulongibacter sediminis]TBX26882.1 ABC transporter permease [Jiulongibacter sediminis]
MEKIALSLSDIVKFKSIAILMVVMKLVLAGVLIYRVYVDFSPATFELDPLFYYFVFVGFIAQLIDGALGMAYGATCSSMMLSVGVPPAYATAGVHTAKVFTAGVSGLSHIFLGNIDKQMFFRIVITGVVGSMIGAYAISEILDGDTIKPFVSIYLVFLGITILLKAFKKKPAVPANRNLGILGLYGGFFDAIGGGGWGPLVTSNLLSKGNPAKETIGTVNTAEFFVAFFSTGIFMLFVDTQAWQHIAALIIGGIFAAPLGAYLVKFIPTKTLMITVAVVVILVSVLNVITVFF